MEFGLTLEIDSKAYKKANLINDLSEELEKYFKNKNYGNDIEEYLIGVICIKTKEGFEDWYKKRKPRYVAKGKSYTYDIKFDDESYDRFVEGSDHKSTRMLVKEIKDSLTNLDKLSKKVRDFEKDRFISDLMKYFHDAGLI